MILSGENSLLLENNFFTSITATVNLVLDIANIHIPLPNFEEQNEIVSLLDFKTEEIEIIITKTQQEIELLKEYKTALISEVVTGKVDVRDVILN